MSDRDESVRKLAEEIAQWHINRARDAGLLHTEAKRWEGRINRFLDEREAALQAQLHRALGEGARLRQFVGTILVLTRTVKDLGPVELMMLGREARAALASSPLSGRAGEVIGAAIEERDLEIRVYSLLKDHPLAPLGDMGPALPAAKEARKLAVDALRAELDQPAPEGEKE